MGFKMVENLYEYNYLFSDTAIINYVFFFESPCTQRHFLYGRKRNIPVVWNQKK
jgi:hypothetical protein